jgi:hypothetical protein
MKTNTFSPVALAVWLLFASGTFHLLRAQSTNEAVSTGSAVALQYFEKAANGKGNLDEYLKSIRPIEISAEQRALIIASIRKDDLVAPSPGRQAKLNALRPVLEYHDRAALPIKILRFPGPLAWAAFLEGAAVLVSEDALDLLTTEELQAVIAHELGHEYFTAEFESARENKQWDKVKEVELRCDAISIITMKSLGLNPNALVSGVTKLISFNEEHGMPSRRNLEPSLNDRAKFYKALLNLTESRGVAFSPIAGKRP